MNQGEILAMTTNMVANLILELGKQNVIPADTIIEMLNRVIDTEKDPNSRLEIQKTMRRLFPGLGL